MGSINEYCKKAKHSLGRSAGVCQERLITLLYVVSVYAEDSLCKCDLV